jgi:hypothetical protein
LAAVMPDQNAVKSFFARARARGSDSNKESVNGEEVKRELAGGTKRNYGRALALWKGYVILRQCFFHLDADFLSPNSFQAENAEASPNDIKASKDFVRCIAYGIEGKYDDPMACVSTVVQYYKDFTGGWQWKGNPTIEEKVTLTTSNVRSFNLMRVSQRCY